MKNIDPRISAKIAENKHKQAIAQANIVTYGKHNGSKRAKTLRFLQHQLNNRVKRTMSDIINMSRG